MIRPTRFALAAVAVVGLASLAACGDSGDDDTSSDSIETDGAEVAEPEAAGEPADCADGGETVSVDIPDFEFAPDPVQVSVCDEIVWSNTHSQAHTSTSNGSFSWSTGNIAVGAESEPIVFDTPGELTYACALHPFMTGTVEVS